MIRHFWQTILSLYFTTLVASILFILALHLEHLVFVQPSSAFQLLTLPNSLPSVWNIVQPAQLTSWVAPVVLLLLQTWLSGGFYGSLIRINTRHHASVASFVADAMRSFWRLLLWYILWDSLALTLAGLINALPMFNITLTLVFLVCSYVLFFVPIGLVAEQATSIRQTVATSIRALLDGFLAMLPYAGLMVLVTASGLAFSSRVTRSGLLLLLVGYLAIMTWLWHMVIARYLLFSNWVSLTTAPSNSQEK